MTVDRKVPPVLRLETQYFFLFSNQTFHWLNRRQFGQQVLGYFADVNYDTCCLRADASAFVWDLWWIKWHCKMYFFQGLRHFHFLTVHQCSTLVFASSTTDGGTAVAQWLRCCATNWKIAGSIPAGVSGFFIDIKSFRSHYDPGVDSASNRNEYQEYFPGGKGIRCIRLTTYHHPVSLSRNLGTLTSWNPLDLSRPVTGLIYLFTTDGRYIISAVDKVIK